LLTDLRRTLLLFSGPAIDKPHLLPVQVSLALHCFTNEFVFVESEEERTTIAALEDDIERTVAGGTEPAPFKLACLASYRGLHRYGWCRRVSPPDSLKDLWKRQVEEVLQESSLRATIPTLKPIDDRTSKEVR